MKRLILILVAVQCLVVIGSLAHAGGSAWPDDIVKYRKTIVVDAAANNGFKDVAAAYASIDGATIDRPILLRIMPGTYNIPALVLDKHFVDIQGSGVGVTILQADVPETGDFDAIYLPAMARISNLSVELDISSTRTEPGTITGIHTFTNSDFPPRLSDLSIFNRYSGTTAWPGFRVSGIVSHAANMLYISLDAKNVTVNINNLESANVGVGIQTAANVFIDNANIVVTGGNESNGLILGMATYANVQNTTIYTLSPTYSYAFQPISVSSLQVTNSSFTSSRDSVLVNGLTHGTISDSVISGRIYDQADLYSPTDTGVILVNCVDASGNPITFPYSTTSP